MTHGILTNVASVMAALSASSLAMPSKCSYDCDSVTHVDLLPILDSDPPSAQTESSQIQFLSHKDNLRQKVLDKLQLSMVATEVEKQAFLY